ncbi:ABC transporter substrate-binding protein [Devosia sp. SL43]|uniref:ABC transporter substrate-binding protein n=1 Tax=Devosia sp. SL43 TaxID=2806348 RepID=UPI001F45330B|nr:ABC transporter substrate-binding protein [Devosia sp. SL43]
MAQSSVEVMHFWTSGGEAAALSEVKAAVEAQGVTWLDAPIAGGGGEQAITAMKARNAAGNQPAAMLMLGYDIKDWAGAGMLTDLKDVAEAGNWAEILPDPVKEFTYIDERWVSAPTNVHRVNMVWASKAAFEAIGAEPPTSWEEFNALAQRFAEAGIIPLAHGGQAWQDLTLFDSVALGIGGPDFYRKAFIDLDAETLGGETMVQVFDQMRVLSGMVDANFAGRDWNLATAMIIEGKAAMQIMGDWSKGEFTNAGKVAGEDYLCFPSPGTDGDFVFLVNSFSMFTQPSDEARAGQAILANAIMDPEVQRKFNIAKGSIPAVKGVSTEGFDQCALDAIADFEAAAVSGTALPTVAFTHAAPSAVVGAISDVVTTHFNSDASSTEAANMLAAAVDSLR